jgi:hypothetical protein
MKKSGLTSAIAAALTALTVTVALGGPAKDARYRVRHGGNVALVYFERRGSFETFTARKAERLEPNIRWIDDRQPAGAQVDIAFAGARRILLVTRTLNGRWLCTVTYGSGDQTAGQGTTFRSVATTHGCLDG